MLVTNLLNLRVPLWPIVAGSVEKRTVKATVGGKEKETESRMREKKKKDEKKKRKKDLYT